MSFLPHFLTGKENLNHIRNWLHELPSDFLKFDFEFRTNVDSKYIEQIGPRYIQRFVWAGCQNYNGYEREKFVRYLALHFRKEDTGPLLMRLADWVPQIREIALSCLAENLSKIDFKIFLNCIGNIRKIHRSNSSEIRHLVDQILENILLESSKSGYVDLKNLHPKDRKFVITHSIEIEKSERYKLLSEDSDIGIRYHILSESFTEFLVKDVEKFLNDKSVRIRREVLRFAVLQNLPERKEYLLKALTDRRRGVRFVAQYYLKKEFQIDAYSHYKNTINDRDMLVIYMSDFEKPEDLELFVSAIDSKNRETKFSAIRSLIQLQKLDRIRGKIFDLAFAEKHLQKILFQNLSKVFSVNELTEQYDVFVANRRKKAFLNILTRKSHLYSILFLMQKLSEEKDDYLTHHLSHCIYYLRNRPGIADVEIRRQIAQEWNRLSEKGIFSAEMQKRMGFAISHL